MSSTKPRVGVVGPCKSGKSTLVRGLHEAGYPANQIAQEHSFAPRMWQLIDPPDILLYLHTEYPNTVARGLQWLERDYAEQQTRLAHARQHADFEISTDELPQEEVLQRVLDFLVTATAE
ncbi:MAG: hypothetical protein KJZ53_10035 [Anaerolineales bacterium]|nr:hypothetical protein [Anaerolineales bacterium]